jgi:hypothetical protein
MLYNDVSMERISGVVGLIESAQRSGCLGVLLILFLAFI